MQKYKTGQTPQVGDIVRIDSHYSDCLGYEVEVTRIVEIEEDDTQVHFMRREDDDYYDRNGQEDYYGANDFDLVRRKRNRFTKFLLGK